jgi:hypothetical protein
MKTMLAALAMLCGAGTAFAQTGSACLFTPAELEATLGHTPEAGVNDKDRLGMSTCRYAMKGTRGIHFSVRIVTKCDQPRFEQHAKTMQSISGKANKPLGGIGDGAYFSPGGTAAARVGGQCVQFSGLNAGAQRGVSEADAGKLLALAASRLGK